MLYFQSLNFANLKTVDIITSQGFDDKKIAKISGYLVFGFFANIIISVNFSGYVVDRETHKQNPCVFMFSFAYVLSDQL